MLVISDRDCSATTASVSTTVLHKSALLLKELVWLKIISRSGSRRSCRKTLSRNSHQVATTKCYELCTSGLSEPDMIPHSSRQSRTPTLGAPIFRRPQATIHRTPLTMDESAARPSDQSHVPGLCRQPCYPARS